MTEELEIKNAKITKVSLSMADYGCLTFYITLDGGGWGCNYGGYCIGKGYLGAKSFRGSEAGLEVLMRIMDTVGVECWEDLKGQYCRVKTEGWGGKILSIGNILKDKWFDIKEFYNTYNETHTFDNNELLDEMDLEKIALDYSTLNSWAVRYYIDKYENAPLNTQLTPSGIVYSTTDGVDTITSLEELTDYIKETKRKENISEF
jgi:hypothetical protein